MEEMIKSLNTTYYWLLSSPAVNYSLQEKPPENTLL